MHGATRHTRVCIHACRNVHTWDLGGGKHGDMCREGKKNWDRVSKNHYVAEPYGVVIFILRYSAIKGTLH